MEKGFSFDAVKFELSWKGGTLSYEPLTGRYFLNYAIDVTDFVSKQVPILCVSLECLAQFQKLCLQNLETRKCHYDGLLKQCFKPNDLRNVYVANNYRLGVVIDGFLFNFADGSVCVSPKEWRKDVGVCAQKIKSGQQPYSKALNMLLRSNIDVLKKEFHCV